MPDPDDRLIRTLVDDPPLRAVAVLMTGTCDEAVRRHGLQGAAAVALGRGLMAGALMATLTKGNERVTVQVLGDGPLGGVTVDANDAGEVRGYVGHAEVALPAPGPGRAVVAGAVGSRGEVVVHRDLGLKEVYQGRIAIWSGEVDEDLERYLSQSEQMGSALRCDVVWGADGRVAWAGGVLVQTTPGAPGTALDGPRERLAAGWVIDALRPATDPLAALTALVDHPVRLLEWRRVCFHCGCDGERVAGALATLGAEVLESMIDQGEPAEVTCRFCSAVHRVEVSVLRRIQAGLVT
jgi:molecular chaperone Hsp33